MVYYEAEWNSATARLLLISTSFQLFIASLFTTMEAFGNSKITYKEFGEITQPPITIENPLDIMKSGTEENEKKEKKDKKKKKRKNKKSKKSKKSKKNKKKDKKGEKEEEKKEEVKIESSKKIGFDSLTKSELLKKLEEDNKDKYQAQFFINWLTKSHILVTSVRLATPAHNFNGILMSYLHCALFILCLTLVWMEAWKVARICILLCTVLNAFNLLESLAQKSFQLDKLESISEEPED